MKACPQEELNLDCIVLECFDINILDTRISSYGCCMLLLEQ